MKLCKLLTRKKAIHLAARTLGAKATKEPPVAVGNENSAFKEQDAKVANEVVKQKEVTKKKKKEDKEAVKAKKQEAAKAEDFEERKAAEESGSTDVRRKGD
jgi:hypothetical protein